MQLYGFLTSVEKSWRRTLMTLLRPVRRALPDGAGTLIARLLCPRYAQACRYRSYI